MIHIIMEITATAVPNQIRNLAAEIKIPSRIIPIPIRMKISHIIGSFLMIFVRNETDPT